MSGEKEIREKIKAITSTRKITKAMEMIAVTKLRVAQERMGASRPYVQKIKEVVNHLAEGGLEYKHPFMHDEKNQRKGVVCYVLIASERGLCGGLNVNLFKKVLEHMQHNHHDQQMCFASIGKKAEDFIKKINVPTVCALKLAHEKPLVTDIIGMARLLEKLYLNQEISKLYVVYNRFGGISQQIPEVLNILPIIKIDQQLSAHNWDYIYEPEAGPLLNMVLQRYLDAIIYQALLENIACEQSARMIAMKNASDNAGEIIEECKLIYNKARQAAITSEISEIVSGAAAV
jgi:F-type H+-transporting ATPase subunit gamma